MDFGEDYNFLSCLGNMITEDEPTDEFLDLLNSFETPHEEDKTNPYFSADTSVLFSSSTNASSQPKYPPPSATVTSVPAEIKLEETETGCKIGDKNLLPESERQVSSSSMDGLPKRKCTWQCKKTCKKQCNKKIYKEYRESDVDFLSDTTSMAKDQDSQDISKSLVHSGDTDSSDDEDKMYGSKYNDFGQSIKQIMKRAKQASPPSTLVSQDLLAKANTPKGTLTKAGTPKSSLSGNLVQANATKATLSGDLLVQNNASKSTLPRDLLAHTREAKHLISTASVQQNVASLKFIKQKMEGNQITETLTNAGNIMTLPLSGIRVYKSIISKDYLQQRMAGRNGVPFSSITKLKTQGILSDEFYTFAVLVRVSPAKSSIKGTKFVNWTLSDLTGDILTTTVLLFGEAAKKFEKTSVGVVIGILNPSVMNKIEGSNKTGFSLAVDSPEKIIIIGYAYDYALCRSLRIDGKPCQAFVNKMVCPECVYHAKLTYSKSKKARNKPPNAFKTKEHEGYFAGRSFSSMVPSKPQKPATAQTLGRGQCTKKNNNRDNIILRQLGSEGKVSGARNMPPNNQIARQTLGIAYGEQQSSNKSGDTKIKLKSRFQHKLTIIQKESQDNVSVKPLDLKMPRMILPKPTPPTSPHGTPTNCNPSSVPTSKIDPTITYLHTPKETLHKQPRSQKADGMHPVSKERSAAALKEGTTLVPPLPANATYSSYREWIKSKKALSDAAASKVAPMKKPRLSLTSPVSDMATVNKHTSASTGTNTTPSAASKTTFDNLLTSTSKHSKLIEVAQNEAQAEYFNSLEQKEKIEEKLLSTFMIPTKVVHCPKCKYTALSSSDLCKAENHKVIVSNGMKRFFKCSDCGNRTMTLQLIPTKSCTKCGGSNWKQAGAIKDTVVHTSNLSIMGNDEKSMHFGADANLNLLVPE